MTTLFRRGWAALVVAMLVTSGCQGDCCAPGDDLLSLFVGVQIDPATFRSDGYVLLELVPADQRGHTFVSDRWDIMATIDEPTSVSATKDTSWVQPADPRPVAAAILIDDSGSMLTNDPNRERAAAAELFAGQFLAANPGNLVALVDFGWPADSASAGFDQTRLLQDYTANAALFAANTDRIQAVEGGGSRLYHSALEVVRWTDTAVAAGYRRVLVIITDGLPTSSDTAFRNELFEATGTSDVRILAVGVGPASDGSSTSVDSSVAVVQELASRTGGVYSGATSTTHLLPVLTALANVSTQSQLLLLLRLNPVPPPGTGLVGTATISGERGSASRTWTATAP